MRWNRPGAAHYQGRWVEYDPPRACAHEGGNSRYPGGYSGRVSFALVPDTSDGTRLTIRHQIPARPEYERAIARLEAYLST